MSTWRLPLPKHAVKIGDNPAHIINERMNDAGLKVRMMKYPEGWYVIPNNPDDLQTVADIIANNDDRPTKAQLEAKQKEDARKDVLDKLKKKLGLTDEEMEALRK